MEARSGGGRPISGERVVKVYENQGHVVLPVQFVLKQKYINYSKLVNLSR